MWPGCVVAWRNASGQCLPPRHLSRRDANWKIFWPCQTAGISRCSTDCERDHTAEVLLSWLEHWTRVEEVRQLGINVSVAHRIPAGRLHALARFANTAKVSVIRRLPESRRLATLVAFAGNLEAAALDDALDLLDILITEELVGQDRWVLFSRTNLQGPHRGRERCQALHDGEMQTRCPDRRNRSAAESRAAFEAGAWPVLPISFAPRYFPPASFHPF